MASQARAESSKPTNKFRFLVKLRIATQFVVLAIFLVLFIVTRSDKSSSLDGFFFKIDPLTVLAKSLSSGVILTSALLASSIVILTLVTGRAWCGWLCPLGTVLDILTPNSQPKKSHRIPDSLRKIKYILLLILLIASLFGNLTLLILDPLTILYRTLTVSLLPATDQLITKLETALYRIPIFQEAISALDAAIRPTILPTAPLYFRQAIFYATLFAAIISLNWIASRFWCRYLCPLGGLLGILSKFALFRRKVSADCKNCSICVRQCPTGTIDAQRGYESDPGECTLCLDCFRACARSSIQLEFFWKTPEWRDYDLNRRDILISSIAALSAMAITRSSDTNVQIHPHRIRPPGASDPDFTMRCIRCSICLRACPTSAIQPSITEAGVEGLWTPVLVPRLGYCDYSCNRCGQVCPTQAIPFLSLEKKRAQIIGKAYIDTNRCIAWSDHTSCIVCEEMCPLPEKAIQLLDTQWADEKGNQQTIKVPYVLRDRCIGCGICEYKCPVNGTAAIRVYTPTIIQKGSSFSSLP